MREKRRQRMNRKWWLVSSTVVGAFILTGCMSMMMSMMGKGDMAASLKNIDKVMPMMQKNPDQAMAYMADQNKGSVERGKLLFSDASLGGNGRSCNTCHPGGTTTGGEVQVPMRPHFKMKIPTLIGSAATFPKYKVPNDAVITLENMSANCVRMFMAGSKMKMQDQRLRDITAYISTFSEGKTLQPAK